VKTAVLSELPSELNRLHRQYVCMIVVSNTSRDNGPLVLTEIYICTALCYRNYQCHCVLVYDVSSVLSNINRETDTHRNHLHHLNTNIQLTTLTHKYQQQHDLY